MRFDQTRPCRRRYPTWSGNYRATAAEIRQRKKFIEDLNLSIGSKVEITQFPKYVTDLKKSMTYTIKTIGKQGLIYLHGNCGSWHPTRFKKVV